MQSQFGAAGDSVIMKLDTVAPRAIVTRPASGASYAMNQKVLAAYFCTDALSGVSSCAGTMADGAGIPTSRSGPQTFAVTATDIAGNVTTKSVTYTVVPPAATPVFSLKTRTYSDAQAVTITDKTP